MTYGYQPSIDDDEYADDNTNQVVMAWMLGLAIAIPVLNFISNSLISARLGEMVTLLASIWYFLAIPVALGTFITAAIFRSRAKKRYESTGKGTATLIILGALFAWNLWLFLPMILILGLG